MTTHTAVTGASSYVGMEVVKQLLQAGYSVHGTLRSMENAQHLRDLFEQHVPGSSQRLTLFQADLLQDQGWHDAFQGCAYLIHVASPFPVYIEDEELLIRIAVEGTLRVLRTATQQGLQRVVLTSSVAAMRFGQPKGAVINEQCWSTFTTETGAYAKSKTLAERAAWDFIEKSPPGQKIEMVAINPVFVYGPAIHAQRNFSSAYFLRQLLRGAYPGLSGTSQDIVDVRDVAAAHMAAMVHPEAPGRRFLLSAGTRWLKEIARVADRVMRPRGYKVVTRELPDGLTRFFSLFLKDARLVVPELGVFHQNDSSLAHTLLGFDPHTPEEAITALLESLYEQNAIDY